MRESVSGYERLRVSFLLNSEQIFCSSYTDCSRSVLLNPLFPFLLDGFSFSSAISCCGSEGRWEEALQLMGIMEKGGPRTRPNRIAYTAAISSCGRAGQVDHALRLFRQMKEQGLSADRVAFNALFYALRVAKRSDAAYELWDEMLGRHQTTARRPNKIAFARSDSTNPDIITLTE